MSSDIFLVVLMGGVLLVVFFMVAILVVRGIWQRVNRRPVSMHQPTLQKDSVYRDGVYIEERGRAGEIVYTEGGNICRFYWEFLGGDAIVGVTFPKKDKWDVTYPWAAGRQAEIMKIVSDEVIRQKAPGRKVRWADGNFDIV